MSFSLWFLQDPYIFFLHFCSCKGHLSFLLICFFPRSAACLSLHFCCCCLSVSFCVTDDVSYQIPVLGILTFDAGLPSSVGDFVCASSVFSGPFSLSVPSPVSGYHRFAKAMGALLDFGVYFSTCRYFEICGVLSPSNIGGHVWFYLRFLWFYVF